MNQQRPFSVIARAYDGLMKDIPYEGWARFVLAVLGGEGCFPRSILELGVGTGNALAPFLKRGLRASGVDASAEMLAIARAKLPGVHLVEADFRSFELGERFDLVYSAFDSLNNLTEPADLQKALERARDHLKPGGWLAADLNTPAGLRELGREGAWEEGGVRLVYGYDPETRLARLEARTEGGLEVHLERGYEPEEVGEMLAAAGFGRVFCLTYPEGRPPHPLSERFWVFAQRPHPAQQDCGYAGFGCNPANP
ncbi:class I SAM-dependent DNA methyltransferase [Oceanithermus sp.]